jgi:hypothetical protein
MAQSTSLPSQRPRVRLWLMFAAFLFTQMITVSASASDPVLDWIAITNDTVLSTRANPLFTARVISQVSASVFDAVNGIEPRYHPLFVRPEAPRHASAGAAAVQAAYAILVKFYPALKPSLQVQRDASIAALGAGESPESILDGMIWGQKVADAIWNWRRTDGFAPPPPPFFGVVSIAGTPAAVGLWRPTPKLNLPGAGTQFATTTPWVLKRASQFRLLPPYALTSAGYASDYNETKTMGAYGSKSRSHDQSELVLFWAGNAPLFWDRIAAQVAASRSLTLSQNAHLFAQLNISIADGGFAVFDTKYRYLFWRPITAIHEGDADGNPATDPDPAWTPWLDSVPAGTPAHPEYPSAHATVSGAAAYVLAATFGDETPFTVTSDARPGTRSFPSFSAAVAEIADARVFGGIHFRTSCVLGNAQGRAVAEYVLRHAMQADQDGRNHSQ